MSQPTDTLANFTLLRAWARSKDKPLEMDDVQWSDVRVHCYSNRGEGAPHWLADLTSAVGTWHWQEPSKPLAQVVDEALAFEGKTRKQLAKALDRFISYLKEG